MICAVSTCFVMSFVQSHSKCPIEKAQFSINLGSETEGAKVSTHLTALTGVITVGRRQPRRFSFRRHRSRRKRGAGKRMEFPFAPPERSTKSMGCSSSRTDLVKPQDLLTEASEPSTTKETKDSRDLQLKLLERLGSKKLNLVKPQETSDGFCFKFLTEKDLGRSKNMRTKSWVVTVVKPENSMPHSNFALPFLEIWSE